VSALILDNSVTMRWCFDGGHHAYADQILDQIGTGKATAFVPLLWRYEVSNRSPYRAWAMRATVGPA